jgi:hypothetical protein
VMACCVVSVVTGLVFRQLCLYTRLARFMCPFLNIYPLLKATQQEQNALEPWTAYFGADQQCHDLHVDARR